jgi:hypothetical protein
MVSQNALNDERKKPAEEMMIQRISYINDDKCGTVKLSREEQMVSQNALNDERKKPAEEMLPVDASVVVSNKRKTFEQRITDLIAFEAKHGHCNASRQLSSEYKSLGEWCSKARSHNKQIQEGNISFRPLSQNKIESLDALGYEWDRRNANHIFRDERFAERRQSIGRTTQI